MDLSEIVLSLAVCYACALLYGKMQGRSMGAFLHPLFAVAVIAAVIAFVFIVY